MNEQVTITHDDVGEAVRSTAVLADITLSMWGGERTDADLMAKVRADAGAVGNVGRVIKNMLAGADGSGLSVSIPAHGSASFTLRAQSPVAFGYACDGQAAGAILTAK